MQRVLMLSTHGETCGIADFNTSLATAFGDLGCATETVRIPRFDQAGLTAACDAFLKKLPEFDFSIVQHEWSFFGDGFSQSATYLAKILNAAAGKTPIVMFMHTGFPELPSPRSFRRADRRMRSAKRALVSAINRRAQLYTFGDAGRGNMIGRGIDPSRVRGVMFPLSVEENVKPPRPLKHGDDVTLGIFGFVSDYKGYETALNALRLLPDNVKLLIAGGKHPRDPGSLTLNSVYGFTYTGLWPCPTLPVPFAKFDVEERERFRQRVRVTGIVPTENVAEIMNSIDIMLAVYQPAPLGSAAMGQVLSLGRPVIASTVASFMEIDQAAECLRLVPPNCPFELAEAILALIDDHPKRMRLHASALAFAQRHSFAALARQVLNGQ